MAYASRSGRARTSSKKPQAFAVCQRCGIWYNRVNLEFQHEWRGAALLNTYILVCKTCQDTPQEQLRAITLPADPTPIFYPSIEDFTAASSDYRTASMPIAADPETGIPIPSTTMRITEDSNNRTLLPFGLPTGLTQADVMPYNGAIQKAFGVPLSLISVTANGTCTVAVTCSTQHGLATKDQVAIAGLAYIHTNGFYSVTVLSATAFSYMTYAPVPSQALLTPTTRIVTALVGLPRDYTTIPKIYSPMAPPVGGGGPIPPVVDNAWLLEDGSGFFLLEDGVTYFGLE
jgi:hypothetical protein